MDVATAEHIQKQRTMLKNFATALVGHQHANPTSGSTSSDVVAENDGAGHHRCKRLKAENPTSLPCDAQQEKMSKVLPDDEPEDLEQENECVTSLLPSWTPQ